MTSQQHYIKNAVKMPLSLLKTKHEKCRAGKSDAADPIVLDIRELEMNFDKQPTTIHRVYIDTPDAAALASVGWVVDEGVEFCLGCSTKFSMFTRRHHCRTCGDITCGVCTANLTYIQSYEELGSQRVCKKCNPMNAKKVRLQSNMSWGKSLYGEGLSLTLPDQTSATTPNYNNNHNNFSNVRTNSRTASTSRASTTANEVNRPTAAEIEAQKAVEAAALRRAKLIKRKQKEDAEGIARAAALAAAAPNSITIIPYPGYVIKSRRRVHDDNKIFINVFHHTTIVDDALMLTFVPYEPEPDPSANTATTSDSTNTSCTPNTANTSTNFGAETTSPSDVTTPPVPIKLKPLIYISAPSSTEDREGYVSLLYNVLVSSTYFKSDFVREQSVHITHPTSVNKIIQAINHRYKENISEDSFVLPKVKSRYHGPPFTQPAVFNKIDCSVVYVDAKLLNSNSTSFKFRSDESVVSAGIGSGGVGSGGGSGSGKTNLNGTRATGGSPTNVTAPGIKVVTKPPRPMRRISSNTNTNNYNTTPITALSPHTPNIHGHDNDDSSIVSDMTQQSNFTDTDMNHIREHRRYSLFASKRVDGVNSITEEMLRLNAVKSIRWEESQQLKEQSMVYPNTLLGYQIILPYNAEMETQFSKGRSMPYIDPSFIYVIVDLAKNNLRKTEYKITNHITGDAWVKLKRGKNKSGIEFRILRKVTDGVGSEKESSMD